jgi:hypothetical protein
MAESKPKMRLIDYVMQLPEGGERERLLQALADAEHIPADKQTVDEVEARYGDGAGSVDINAYVEHELATSPARNEFESLMRTAAILQVRLAFIEVETPEGKRFVRIGKLQ